MKLFVPNRLGTPMLSPACTGRIVPFWRLTKLACYATWCKCLYDSTFVTWRRRVERSCRDEALSLDRFQKWMQMHIIPDDVLKFLFEGGDFLPIAQRYLQAVPACHHKQLWFRKLKAEVIALTHEREVREERVQREKQAAMHEWLITPSQPAAKPAAEKPLNQWIDGKYRFFGDLCDTPS